MKFTINTGAGKAEVSANAGRVVLNGAMLLPHEAAMLADSLIDCAERAERQADFQRQVQRLQVVGERAGTPVRLIAGA